MKLSLRAIVRAYMVSIAFWCAMALLMGLQYIPLDRHHLWSSLLNLLLQAGARAFALALWTPPIFFLAEKYIRFSLNRIRYVFLWGMGAIPFVLLHTLIAYLVIPPYTTRSVRSWLEIVRTGFADDTFIYLAMVVAAHAYEYLKRLRREERDRYEYQQAFVASELQALKMQLQPHFLFNTLHGIATLLHKDPNNAHAMIIELSDLLRVSLERRSSDLISLEEELEFARRYLTLEEMRFGARLKIRWMVAPETRRLVVPQMILQPLVENAIRHGVSSAREGGWIEIAASVSQGRLNLSVGNNLGDQTANGTGVGMRNIHARLKFLYDGDASLRLIVSEDHTATAVVSLPALHSQPEQLQSRTTV